MANAQRGEVGFEAGGRSYTMCFSINSLCEMEDVLGTGVHEFCRQLVAGDVRLTTIRAAFWAGLREHHPDVSLTDAGNLIHAVGGAERALSLLGDALSLAFPSDNGAAPRPRVGRDRGTPGQPGVGSASTRSSTGG